MRRSTQRGCFWENTPSRIKYSITGCSAVGSAPALGVRMHSSMRLLANPATLSNTKRTRFSELFAIRIFSGNTTDLLLQFSISYSSPGVAQLVARVVWERCGFHPRWIQPKPGMPCNTGICGISPDSKTGQENRFDHINDHRQEKTLNRTRFVL